MVIKGAMIAIYFPLQLLELAEQTREKLGMNRSRFYQYCVMKTLQELNVLSETIQKETLKDALTVVAKTSVAKNETEPPEKDAKGISIQEPTC